MFVIRENIMKRPVGYTLGKESFLFNITTLIRVSYPYSQVPHLTLFEQRLKRRCSDATIILTAN